jgi:hypothetical protein
LNQLDSHFTQSSYENSFFTRNDDAYTLKYEPVFQLNLSNYGLHYGEKYVLDTWDMLIGVVGGFYALIWALFGYCMSDYEAFNKSQGLIADFYSSEDPSNFDSRRNNN